MSAQETSGAQTLAFQGLVIGGRRVAAADGATFDDLNPATGQTLCTVAAAGVADIDRAVTDAGTGFAVWSHTPGAERARILGRIADRLRAQRDALARLEVLDTGKPIAEAPSADIDSAADCFAYFAGIAATLSGRHIDLGAQAFAYTRREPLGVCAAIGAWNYPIQIASWKAAPALACGNAMVFKPSEQTPVTAGRLAELMVDAGLPPGVFNVVHGDGAVGAALVRHPGVAKVSVTGSVHTGRRVMAAAADGLIPVTLELGGKSPLIVFDDADLDNAVSAAMLANFYTQGEICSNGTRVFVQAGLHDAFVDRLVARTERLKVGDPLDPATEVGSLISTAHLERVLGYVDQGISAGARLRCGGTRLPGPGAFLTPAVFDQCRDEMIICREEIFGPVASVLRFNTETEVIERANATPFGLAAGVFTRDLARGHRVVAALDAGTCWINGYNLTPIEMPFGGVKGSGIGRENGWEAIEAYTRVKSVHVSLSGVACPYGQG